MKYCIRQVIAGKTVEEINFTIPKGSLIMCYGLQILWLRYDEYEITISVVGNVKLNQQEDDYTGEIKYYLEIVK